jgi:hypothetical protein
MSSVSIFGGKIKPLPIIKKSIYNKFIGKKFLVKGFNEPRTVEIKEVYGESKKLSCFRCEVIGDYKHFKNGDRENFLCNTIIKNGKIIKIIKVLSA